MLPVLIPENFQNPEKGVRFCGEYVARLLTPLSGYLMRSLPSSKVYCPHHLSIRVNGEVNYAPGSDQVYFSHRGHPFMLKCRDIWYIKNDRETTNYLWVNPEYLHAPRQLTA